MRAEKKSFSPPGASMNRENCGIGREIQNSLLRRRSATIDRRSCSNISVKKRPDQGLLRKRGVPNSTTCARRKKKKVGLPRRSRGMGKETRRAGGERKGGERRRAIHCTPLTVDRWVVEAPGVTGGRS